MHNASLVHCKRWGPLEATPFRLPIPARARNAPALLNHFLDTNTPRWAGVLQRIPWQLPRIYRTVAMRVLCTSRSRPNHRETAPSRPSWLRTMPASIALLPPLLASRVAPPFRPYLSIPTTMIYLQQLQPPAGLALSHINHILADAHRDRHCA